MVTLPTIGYRLREALGYAEQSLPAQTRADYVSKAHNFDLREKRPS